MKLFFRMILTFVLICMGIFSLVFFSCGQKNPDLSTTWFTDTNSYRTNDLNVAQQETPFNILLPEYVPHDLISLPYIYGMNKNDFIDSRPIRIMYYRNGEDFNPILIEEYNTSINYYPGDNYTLIDISDVEVIEETTKTLKDVTTFILQYCYSWNYNGIHYTVEVAEYENKEGRKIVESMIKQLK